MKTCTKCGVEKPEELYNKKHGRPQSVCKDCHAAYRKQHYENNRQKYIDKAAVSRQAYREEYYEWLSNQTCSDCGISDPRVLEFDHLRDKEFTIAKKVGGRKLSSLLNELNKGEIVCANCHRIRTATRGGWAKSRLD